MRGYATIRQRWRKGDVVALRLPMPPERLYADPRVRMDVGRTALRRGPLIYCVEEADKSGGSVQTLTLPRDAAIEPERREDLLGGIVTLTTTARRLMPAPDAPLYTPSPPTSDEAVLAAIPYFLWANREAGSMQVSAR